MLRLESMPQLVISRPLYCPALPLSSKQSCSVTAFSGSDINMMHDKKYHLGTEPRPKTKKQSRSRCRQSHKKTKQKTNTFYYSTRTPDPFIDCCIGTFLLAIKRTRHTVEFRHMSSTADYKPPPQWLSEGDVSDSSHDAGATSSHGLTSAGGAQRTRNSSASTKKILQYKTHIMWALKICTVVFSSLMLFTALYGLSGMRGVGEINRVFVGVYMLCFSIMLITFEVIQLQPVEALDHMYQRNFGFLYGVKGKGLFIILYVYLFKLFCQPIDYFVFYDINVFFLQCCFFELWFGL